MNKHITILHRDAQRGRIAFEIPFWKGRKFVVEVDATDHGYGRPWAIFGADATDQHGRSLPHPTGRFDIWIAEETIDLAIDAPGAWIEQCLLHYTQSAGYSNHEILALAERFPMKGTWKPADKPINPAPAQNASRPVSLRLPESMADGVAVKFKCYGEDFHGRPLYTVHIDGKDTGLKIDRKGGSFIISLRRSYLTFATLTVLRKCLSHWHQGDGFRMPGGELIIYPANSELAA